MKEYILTSAIYHVKKKIVFYGIALIDENQGSCKLIKEFNDLLESQEYIQRLVDNFNKGKLDESKLLNVVEDLLSH